MGREEQLTPIAGVSLDEWAELVAEMADVLGDEEKCAAIAAARGIERARWDEAVRGWNARLRSPATCDDMAVYYLPKLNAALARRGRAPETTLDDFVRMTAAINEPGGGLARMYAEFGIDAVAWSQIASRFGHRVLADADFRVDFQKRVVDEIARRAASRAGGGDGSGGRS